MNIVQALNDPQIFGTAFTPLGDWSAWGVALRAAFGLGFENESQLSLFRQCTGRSRVPQRPFRELWIAAGRSAGKSRNAALIGAHMAVFEDWRPYLAPGERAVVMLLAPNRAQARVVHGYLRALLVDNPMLSSLVVNETSESIELDNRVTLEIHSSSFRAVRGYSAVCCICDEIAFWFDAETSRNPDSEILRSLRPALARMPGSMLVGISSPYAKRGVLYDTFKSHYAKDDSHDVLAWRAPTRIMNPKFPQSEVDRALAEDPEAARAEYLGEFRDDVHDFLPRETIEACVTPGILERPPERKHRYRAFTDPSGGHRDSFSLAIAHREADCVVLDLLREAKPPFRPDEVVARFSDDLRRYSLRTVTGDSYAGLWPVERFQAHGVKYERANLTRSQIYLDALPVFMGARVLLLDEPRLVTQLAGLERRTARSGRDTVDHRPGAFDDLGNACAGAICLALMRPRGVTPKMLYGPRRGDPDYVAPPEEKGAAR